MNWDDLEPDRIILPDDAPDGVLRKLVSYQTESALMRGYTADFDIPDVPESDWREFEYSTTLDTVEDQGDIGACNGFGASGAEWWVRWLAGLGTQRLSPWFVYAILCQGRDVGSSPHAALELLKTLGTCSFDRVPIGLINPRNLTQGAYDDALRFRVQRGPHISGFRQLMSATQLGFVVNGTLHADNGIYKLDRFGVSQNRPGVHNHAIVKGLGAKRLPDGRWAVKYKNSWGRKFGLEGYAWGTEATFEGSYAEEFAVASASFDPRTYTPPVRLAI